MKISIKFHDQPVIEVVVDDTETGRLYFDLTQLQNKQEPPFYRDTNTYTPDYMIELAHRAKTAFGWEWLTDHYDISITAQLHKDLENSVGQIGFENIPEQHDTLLYELHHCLHAIQFGKTSPHRLDNLQIEWLTDQSVPLPASFEFKEYSQFGDALLINPYVGHNPLQIYRENDFGSLNTTCRFHDVIKPGIVLTGLGHVDNLVDTKDEIVAEFKRQDPEFVELHGEEKIRYYAGTAVIGHAVDLDILKQVKQSTTPLVLDQVEFHE